MNLDLVFDWTILLGGLLLLTYTAIVIREEKKSFQENIVDFEWQNHLFFIPSWWSNTSSPLENPKFERTDTKYDWSFEISLKELGPKETLQSAIQKILQTRGIEFDQDGILSTDADQFFIESKTKERAEEFVRMEGTASEGTERKYLDFVFFRDAMQPNTFLFCESCASVLNGGVEGPYVEEVLKTLQIIN